jgi:predicted RNase H-like nuclease (RuvC/YqgF family)
MVKFFLGKEKKQMPQESYSDFSIVKDYIELKNKYDNEIQQFKETIKSMEERFKTQASVLEVELKKRNENIKAFEANIQELTAKIVEKDEQMKNLGFQLHKMKMSQDVSEQQNQPTENNKKKGFFS